MWAGREEMGVNGGVAPPVGVVVAEKRRAFEELLQRIDRDTYHRYRAQRAVVKSF